MNSELKLIFVNIGFLPSPLVTNKEMKKEIKLLVNQNKIYKEKVVIFGEIIETYYLSEREQNNLKEEGYYLYRSKKDQIVHDFVLLKIFLNCTLEEKMNWLNETFLKIKFKDIETTDAVIMKNDKLIAIEVLTSNYRKDKIQRKKNFINEYCDDSILINSNEI